MHTQRLAPIYARVCASGFFDKSVCRLTPFLPEFGLAFLFLLYHNPYFSHQRDSHAPCSFSHDMVKQADHVGRPAKHDLP
jgi:hypothetical protein